MILYNHISANSKQKFDYLLQVGDNLALRFEISDKTSPYEIFVRELVAMDGQDSSEILLIDGRGCPTDPSIMQSVIQVYNIFVLTWIIWIEISR